MISQYKTIKYKVKLNAKINNDTVIYLQTHRVNKCKLWSVLIPTIGDYFCQWSDNRHNALVFYQC